MDRRRPHRLADGGANGGQHGMEAAVSVGRFAKAPTRPTAPSARTASAPPEGEETLTEAIKPPARSADTHVREVGRRITKRADKAVRALMTSRANSWSPASTQSSVCR